jgi:hypothetical protein
MYKFHENEVEELNIQVGLLVPSSDDDKIQEKEQQISHAEFNQQEILSLHIPAVFKNNLISYHCNRGSNF